jgi:hypothetical protein
LLLTAESIGDCRGETRSFRVVSDMRPPVPREDRAERFSSLQEIPVPAQRFGGIEAIAGFGG